jgi:hypothetical protein
MLCFCSLSRFLIKTETSARPLEAELQKTMAEGGKAREREEWKGQDRTGK